MASQNALSSQSREGSGLYLMHRVVNHCGTQEIATTGPCATTQNEKESSSLHERRRSVVRETWFVLERPRRDTNGGSETEAVG